MDSKKQRDVLFISFLILFIITTGMTLVGICVSWKYPNVSYPNLGKLITITIVEVCGGIVLLFYKTFGLEKRRIGVSSTETKYDPIKDCFNLFKGCLHACSEKEINFRLHFLSYDSVNEKLLMTVQDEMYEDSHFEFYVESGCKKGIVVCKALKRDGLITERLKDDHYVKYPNSPIRKKLKEVMAFPIKTINGKIIGIVALDSDEEFQMIGIAVDKLEHIFLKLCKVIENLMKIKWTEIS